MAKETSDNRELPFLVAMNTSLLCIVFGANAVAIKISLFGLERSQQQDSASLSQPWRFFFGLK